MKNIYLLSLITLFFFACNEGTSTNQNDTEQTEETSSESESLKKYPFKSGTVKYVSDAMGMQTTLQLYFKDFGAEECSVSEIEMMGQKMTMRSLTKDGYLYSLEMSQKRGTKMKVEADFSPYRINAKILAEKLQARS